MRPYVVRQGDYLAKLAARMGFDAETVWNAPENEVLRRRRSSPDVLCPGDVLHLPTARLRSGRLVAESKNRYRARIALVTVRFQLRVSDRPVASRRYLVEGAGRTIEGQSDGDGFIELRVPTTVSEVRVRLPDLHRCLVVQVGHLDPAQEQSGIRQRLANLGYLATSATDGGDETAVPHAIARFQIDHGLPGTGVADEATAARLLAAHSS
jgi:hypothetical protein